MPLTAAEIRDTATELAAHLRYGDDVAADHLLQFIHVHYGYDARHDVREYAELVLSLMEDAA